MTDTQETTSLNGSAPPATEPAGPCDDCATSGEKLLAVLAAAFGLFILAMAIDMFTGGKVSGMVREQVAR